MCVCKRCQHLNYKELVGIFRLSISTGPEQLPLSEVREATKELQSEWYSLAVELEISYSVRKVGMVTDHL